MSELSELIKNAKQFYGALKSNDDTLQGIFFKASNSNADQLTRSAAQLAVVMMHISILDKAVLDDSLNSAHSAPDIYDNFLNSAHASPNFRAIPGVHVNLINPDHVAQLKALSYLFLNDSDTTKERLDIDFVAINALYEYVCENAWELITENMYSHTMGNKVQFYSNSFNDDEYKTGYFPDLFRAIEDAKNHVMLTGWAFDIDNVLGMNDHKSIGERLVAAAFNGASVHVMIFDHHEGDFVDSSDKASLDNISLYLDALKKTLDLDGLALIASKIKNYTENGDDLEKLKKILDVWIRKFGEKNSGVALLSDVYYEVKSYRNFKREDDVGRQQDAQDIIDLIARWGNLNFKLTPGNSILSSDHQKFCIADRIEYSGGLDLTSGRVDCPSHAGKKSQKWHDVAQRIEGPSVTDTIKHFAGRWKAIPDEKKFTVYLPNGNEVAEKKLTEISRNLDKNPIAPCDDASTGTIQTVVSMYQGGFAGDLGLKKDHTSEIQDAYLNAIKSAKKFIYMDMQYFSGPSAEKPDSKNKIIAALRDQILEQHKEGKPFHFYCTLPMRPDGDIDSVDVATFLKAGWECITWLIDEVNAKTDGKASNYITFMNMMTNHAAQDASNPLKTESEMVYVHSKCMIVDDKKMIIGSANCNERSMSGEGDTEYAKYYQSNNDLKMGETIKAFRKQLMREMVGQLDNEALLDNPEKPECREAIEARLSKNLTKLDNGIFHHKPMDIDEIVNLTLSALSVYNAEKNIGLGSIIEGLKQALSGNGGVNFFYGSRMISKDEIVTQKFRAFLNVIQKDGYAKQYPHLEKLVEVAIAKIAVHQKYFGSDSKPDGFATPWGNVPKEELMVAVRDGVKRKIPPLVERLTSQFKVAAANSLMGMVGPHHFAR